MEKTISKLFEIEEKAKLIINRANDEKIKLHDAFEAEIEKMEKTIAGNSAKKIKEYKAEIEKELEKEKKALMLISEKHLAELDETYQKHHKDLVDKIFNSIITS